MEERFFFKVNLNKFGELRQKMEAENKFFINIVVAFLVMAALLAGGFFFFMSQLNTKLDNRKALLKDINKEISSYRKSGGYLSTKDLERLASKSTDRIFWTKKLEALAAITADKIAITHFDFKNSTLSLYGITQVDKKQDEHALIDNFIKDLKANEQISHDFPQVKFVKSYRDRELNVDIMRFQVDCKTAEKEKKKAKKAKKGEDK